MTPLRWFAVALTLVGALLLIVDIGAAGLWIAVITVGLALSVLARRQARPS
jgi:hypothetical protein